MKRFTLDIDSKKRLYAILIFSKILFNVKKIKRIEVLKSHNNNYHFIIWTTYKYKKYEIFKLREKLNDDKHRLSMDKLRRFGRETLFYKKQKI